MATRITHTNGSGKTMRASPVTLPLVVAHGGPQERGRAVGRELAEPIHRSLAFYRAFWERRGIDLQAALPPYLAAAERALPHLVEQIRAMAEGAEADFWELFAVNTYEELDESTDPDRCSTFTAAAPGATILAHTEMWCLGDLGNVAVVVERPHEGPAVVSPTVVCSLPAAGVNSHGSAEGIDSLTARTDRVGVPRVLVSRHSLDAADPADAVARAGLAGRAGGYAHVYAFRGGEQLAIETTADRLAVVERQGHANHYLDPKLAEVGDEPSPGSLSRQARLDALLSERPPQTPDDAMELLRDHAGEPQGICHHPPGGEDDAEASAVVFAFVAELEAGRLWVAGGNPCEHPFEEVDLSDVV
jgi:isopenicillin-N N-acyltransferase like protein